MKLNIIDRVVILIGLLPPSGSIEDMKKNKSIKDKVKLTKEEESMGVVLNKDQNNNVMLKYISEEAKCHYTDIIFSDEERLYLKDCANKINELKGVTETNLDTILLLMSED